MTKHHMHSSNLLFLLAAAPMGMGCIIVTDDGDDTTGADTGNNQTTGNQTSDGTVGPDTGSATGDGTGTAGTMETGAPETGVVDSTATEGEDTTGGGANVCADYAALAAECGLPYAKYIESYCNTTLEYLEAYSAECGMAYADFIGCLSVLSCAELGGDAPCTTELDAFLALGCPSAE
jgi:hypothetical protein